MEIARVAEILRRRIHTGIVRTILDRTGLEPILREVYFDFLYTVSSDYTLDVRGFTCELEFTTREEFVSHLLNSTTERAVMEDVLEELNPGDVFFDVGANVGVYSCLVGQKVTTGSVIAFEPHPVNAARCRENLEKNGVDGTVFEYALSDDVGSITLVPGTETGGAVNAHISEGNEGEGTEARVSTGEQLIGREGIPSPTAIKVDVEGAELKVLRGLKEPLRNHCRVLYCEIHPEVIGRYGDSKDELLRFIRDVGFTDIQRVTERELPDSQNDVHIKAVK